MSVRASLSANSQADRMTKAGLANSDGWNEWPAKLSQRRAPWISGPMKCTATMQQKATRKSTSASRRTPRGENSEIVSMMRTPIAENRKWRSTK